MSRVKSTMLGALLLAVIPACGGSDDSEGKGKLKQIQVTPDPIILRDRDTTISLKVTGITTTGKRVALEGNLSTGYTSLDASVAWVTPVGVVGPAGEGRSQIVVSYPGFSATVDLYSDYAPDLNPGDFDLVGPDQGVRPGSRVTVPVMLETGGQIFGSFRAKLTYDPTHLEFVRMVVSEDLGEPTAVRSDTPGEVEVADTYEPSKGQSLTGTLEVARIVFRAVGAPGTASIVTGHALGVSDSSFPAGRVGLETPRSFITGKRWLVIR